MPAHHLLEVIDLHHCAEDAVELTLKPVAAESAEQFSFLAGQYLTLGHDFEGERIWRNYSLCSAPHEGKLRVAARMVPGGIFSGWINRHMQTGDVLYGDIPRGNFTIASDQQQPLDVFAIATGSGITPIISLIKSLLYEQPQAAVTLLYGNRSHNSMMFTDELLAIKNIYMSRFNAAYVFSREQHELDMMSGYIDEQKIVKYVELAGGADKIDFFLLCGMPELIELSQRVLGELGVVKQKILNEHFILSDVDRSKIALRQKQRREKTGAGKSHISLKLNGVTTSFKLDKAGEPILSAGLAAGLNLPFSCRGGMCCTCRAKVVQGEVDMDLNYALLPEELEAGYILTCQAHPLTDSVAIDFDQR